MLEALTKGELFPETSQKLGHRWEREVFGLSSAHFIRPEGKVAWEKAFLDMISAQESLGWDPRKPKTAMAREMFKNIQGSLPFRLAGDLQMYCALGTRIDFQYGIDGLFTAREYLVTFDLCTYKKEVIKAQVLLGKKEILKGLSEITDKFYELIRKGKPIPPQEE